MSRGMIALFSGFLGLLVNIMPLLWIKYIKKMRLDEYQKILFKKFVEPQFSDGEHVVAASVSGGYVYMWGGFCCFAASSAAGAAFDATPIVVFFGVVYMLCCIVSQKFIYYTITVTNISVYIARLFPCWPKIQRISHESIHKVNKKSCVRYVTISVNGKPYFDDTSWRNPDALVSAIEKIM